MPMREHAVTDYESLLGDNVQVVDVREPEETDAGTLPNVILIPLGDIPARMGELDSSKTILVVCKAGGRSAKAGQFLVQNGFGDVVNLSGGMLAWQDR